VLFPAAVLLVLWGAIHPEERFMHKRFGAPYDDYTRRRASLAVNTTGLQRELPEAHLPLVERCGRTAHSGLTITTATPPDQMPTGIRAEVLEPHRHETVRHMREQAERSWVVFVDGPGNRALVTAADATGTLHLSETGAGYRVFSNEEGEVVIMDCDLYQGMWAGYPPWANGELLPYLTLIPQPNGFWVYHTAGSAFGDRGIADDWIRAAAELRHADESAPARRRRRPKPQVR
jgi:hypothetical protein